MYPGLFNSTYQPSGYLEVAQIQNPLLISYTLTGVMIILWLLVRRASALLFFILRTYSRRTGYRMGTGIVYS